ncbi:conserved hypothetical protein [Pseudomonas sp. 8Z]|uniref:FagA protein n=1 Tax=Pseudomonas sp. 8Z TaxID=2653166 RepID=UPI0012F32919|nr:FagA protein [Pseudomonas sp. 8Z]VXD03103.1 conserved hypothetical protein [Pseudomonas sp. 8Z]
MYDPFFTPCANCWRWQGFVLRCALRPDEPRLFDVHEWHGRQLVAHGLLDAWRVSRITFELLLDSASDPALPWHWRCLCLDRAYRPLLVLQRLATDLKRQHCLNRLRNRLATLRLEPSLSFNESAEGYPYD